MNKRLVWNFEINADHSLCIPSPQTPSENACRWESRFFWPSHEIIILYGLSPSFYEISRYKITHKEDTYIILPDEPLNLKLRQNELYYKPMLSQQSGVVAYGKKIKINDCSPNMMLPGCDSEGIESLLCKIQSEGIPITVKKEALVYSFDSTPSIKLELSWLRVAQQEFYSISIESKAFAMVEAIQEQLIKNKKSSDYVTFLKGLGD